METILIVLAGIAAIIAICLAAVVIHYGAIAAFVYFAGCLTCKLFGYFDATPAVSFYGPMLVAFIIIALTNPNRRVVVAVRV